MAVTVLAGGACVGDSHPDPCIMVIRVSPCELDSGYRVLARQFARFVSGQVLGDGNDCCGPLVRLRSLA